MSRKKVKPRKVDMPAIKADEREQVRIRRRLGLDLALDEYGRERVPNGRADDRRRFDQSKTGVIRLRTADPLKEIKGLTDRQRNAGSRYRDDYEIASQSGIKPASMQERVDISTTPKDVSIIALRARQAVAIANDALGHHEIQMVVERVCGLRESIREISARTRDPRPALAKLLTIGLDKLADAYFGPVTGKRGSKL